MPLIPTLFPTKKETGSLHPITFLCEWNHMASFQGKKYGNQTYKTTPFPLLFPMKKQSFNQLQLHLQYFPSNLYSLIVLMFIHSLIHSLHLTLHGIQPLLWLPLPLYNLTTPLHKPISKHHSLHPRRATSHTYTNHRPPHPSCPTL